ncbi:MAG: prepilin-type N-terminal cleavage/methylation domain-containing protein [Planctomycetota bacterium]|jgi:prepilin-type N-terminal cleavage/methylation domain-containing protein
MTHRAPTRSGFTLLEVIVVISIIAVLATLAVPRLTGTARRTFDLTADKVGDLLLMFAQRDSLGQSPVGIRYDTDLRKLELVTLRRYDDGSSDWLVDRFVTPIELPDLIDEEQLAVYADGEWVDVRDFPLSHTPGETRPSIEIYLTTIDGAHETTVVLSPHAVAPRRSDRTDLVARRAPIDLDGAGRSREDW